ncbi:hypothetical protein GGR50DRAFT_664829 [Xylaria sp. CBS 124048]|nr:hypothetical protein GGR50DRAFT_664829 [Xylaria sp. CBS 124048]
MEGHSPPKVPEDLLEPVAAPCQFTRFPSLPPELRHTVWDMFIDSLTDVSELLVHESSEFTPLNDPITAPTVYTAFPATMHVNHEARHISKRRIRLTYSSNASCMVPVRPFRPELDVLYIPWEAWRSFFLLKEFHYGEEWLSKLQHVAVDICLSTNLVAFFRQVRHIPAVRTLRFVVASREGHSNSNSMLILPTPASRCILRSFPANPGPPNNGDEAANKGRRIPLYLDYVNSEALGAAERAMELAPTEESRAAVEHLIDTEERKLKLAITANILMKYCHLRKGSEFVEVGKDHVAELVLCIR